MSSTTLFEMPFSEFQLKNAVSSALQQSLNNPTKFSIESNLEAAVRDTIQNNLGNIKIGENSVGMHVYRKNYNTSRQAVNFGTIEGDDKFSDNE